MPRIVQSGAFLRQCFASHRLSLLLQQAISTGPVVVHCRVCRLSHHVRLEPPSLVTNDGQSSLAQLLGCAETHPLEVLVREVDCMEDRLTVHCRSCQALYAFHLAACETHFL